MCIRDSWWTTANKMNAYLKAEGFDTLHILHNNSYSVEGYAICGTRGWLFDVGEPHDEKVKMCIRDRRCRDLHRSPRGLRCRHRACLPRQQPLR